jgi:hypothetical protein
MHRSAWVILRRNFHLGKWTPQQCVQSLLDNVGFEPDNAAGEVRAAIIRWFGGAAVSDCLSGLQQPSRPRYFD